MYFMPLGIRSNQMLMEQIWRKRLILSFVILIAWMLNISTILFFSSRNPEVSAGVGRVLASVIIIVAYFILIKRIVELEWRLNKNQLFVIKPLLWLMYPVFAFNIFVAFRILGIDFYISESNTLITNVGVYGTILLMITLGVIFNRWQMAFNKLEHEFS